METNVARQLDGVKTKMLGSGEHLRAKPLGPVDMRRVVDIARRDIGQCFEWSLEQARMQKKEAAALMGYANQAEITDFITGEKNLPLGKVKACLPTVWPHFAMAMVRTTEGIEVKTVLSMRMVG